MVHLDIPCLDAHHCVYIHAYILFFVDFLILFLPDEKLNEIGINTHIMPGMYTLLDIAVSATPRRLLHAYQPSAFLTIYTLFNLIYYLCGGVVGINMSLGLLKYWKKKYFAGYKYLKVVGLSGFFFSFFFRITREDLLFIQY